MPKLFTTKALRLGESALVTKLNGRTSVKVGPCRIAVVLKKVERLRMFHAGEMQYLRVEMLSGDVVHMRGPVALSLNPIQHHHISVRARVQPSPSWTLTPPCAVFFYRLSIFAPSDGLVCSSAPPLH